MTKVPEDTHREITQKRYGMVEEKMGGEEAEMSSEAKTYDNGYNKYVFTKWIKDHNFQKDYDQKRRENKGFCPYTQDSLGHCKPCTICKQKPKCKLPVHKCGQVPHLTELSCKVVVDQSDQK